MDGKKTPIPRRPRFRDATSTREMQDRESHVSEKPTIQISELPSLVNERISDFALFEREDR